MMSDTSIRPELRQYIEESIIPQYDGFDPAHRRDHVQMVIQQSLEMARNLGVREEMAYVIAAYHDVGLCEGREHHHEVSAKMMKADARLLEWFSQEDIQMMADAAEDHRASAAHAPHTIYGRIVAEADRFIDPETIIQRTVQFGLEHYPELSREEHYERMMTHLHEKYGRGGYLHLWFDDSPNAARLERLREMMTDAALMRRLFERFFLNS